MTNQELRTDKAAMQRPRIDPHLAAVSLFRTLRSEHLRLVSALTTHLELPAGAVLTTEHGGLEFVVVVRGELEVRRDGRIETRGPGEWVGEMALVADVPTLATVVASTPVIVEAIRRHEFLGLLDDFPDLADQIAKAKASTS